MFLRTRVIFARLTTEKVPEAAAEPTEKDDDFKAMMYLSYLHMRPQRTLKMIKTQPAMMRMKVNQ